MQEEYLNYIKKGFNFRGALPPDPPPGALPLDLALGPHYRLAARAMSV